MKSITNVITLKICTIYNVVSKLAFQNVWQSSHLNIERFYTREPVRRPSSKLLHQAIRPSANGYAKLTDLCLAAELIKGITSTFANLAAKYGYEEETDRHSFGGSARLILRQEAEILLYWRKLDELVKDLEEITT